MQLTEVVPLLVEDALQGLGGDYSRAEDWHSHVVVDGTLITGQNPASSEGVAEALARASSTAKPDQPSSPAASTAASSTGARSVW